MFFFSYTHTHTEIGGNDPRFLLLPFLYFLSSFDRRESEKEKEEGGAKKERVSVCMSSSLGPLEW